MWMGMLMVVNVIIVATVSGGVFLEICILTKGGGFPMENA